MNDYNRGKTMIKVSAIDIAKNIIKTQVSSVLTTQTIKSLILCDLANLRVLIDLPLQSARHLLEKQNPLKILPKMKN